MEGTGTTVISFMLKLGVLNVSRFYLKVQLDGIEKNEIIIETAFRYDQKHRIFFLDFLKHLKGLNLALEKWQITKYFL